ncbi:hypothetical protein NCCP28_08160 [Niallia sp. NCCP-28]|nr:hypothetical protein NCCP28_08160 [Niallia sp. NCCP-28]
MIIIPFDKIVQVYASFFAYLIFNAVYLFFAFIPVSYYSAKNLFIHWHVIAVSYYKKGEVS